MIHYHTLDNGLTVIMEPVDGVVSVSTGLWLRVGSRHEREDQYGYAHFVEHLLFKGTEKYTSQELARAVDRVGGQHNAATNREYTCYYLNLVSDHLELAMDILSEMYYRPRLDGNDIEKEKGIIIEEIRMYEDAPDEFVHDYFFESMFQNHPLGHSILGTIEGIEEASESSIRNFYNEHYSNANALLTIAGKFDVNATIELLNRYFSTPRPGKRIESSRMSHIRVPDAGYRYHNERDLEQVHFCLGVEGIQRDDPMRWPLYSLSTVFGGSMSSRLFQNVREKEGISYSIYSFHSSYSDRGTFGVYCATNYERFEQALDLILRECRILALEGITAEELEDTKTFMKGNLALSYESNDIRMAQLAKNELAFSRQFTYDEISRLIDKISLDDFRAISDNLFVDKSFSLISVGSLKGLNRYEINLKII